MKKNNWSGKVPMILLVAAAIFMVASTVGSTNAALTFQSQNYSAEVALDSIGVTLVENDKDISYRDYIKDDKWKEKTGELLEKMLKSNEELVLGKAYKEELCVKNSGQIDSYVRVVITKNWLDPEGNIDTKLSPELIELNLVNKENWLLDEEASTTERTVLYYNEILPVGESTPLFADTLTISPVLGEKVLETVTVDKDGYKTITHTYEYDGYSFNLEATVFAVQTHNVETAVKSAWGRDIEVISEDGKISLK